MVANLGWWILGGWLVVNMVPAFLFISTFGYKSGTPPLSAYYKTWQREPGLIWYWLGLGPIFWPLLIGSGITSRIHHKRLARDKQREIDIANANRKAITDAWTKGQRNLQSFKNTEKRYVTKK